MQVALLLKKKKNRKGGRVLLVREKENPEKRQLLWSFGWCFHAYVHTVLVSLP